MRKLYFACIYDWTGRPEAYGPGQDSTSPKYSASVRAVSHLDNVMEALHGCKVANACRTRKEACELAEEWNNSFRRNGTYIL